jgi:hypothetical protein
LTEVCNKVASSLPFVRQLDILRIATYAVDTYKTQAMPIIQSSFALILAKAEQSALVSHVISDDERSMMATHEEFVKTIYMYVDRLG